VCGNGKTEPGEDCDNGSLNGQPGNGCSATCTFVNIMNTAIEVRWTINAMAAPMFDSESCFTLATPAGQGYQVYTSLMLSGPAPMSGEFKCSDGSRVFIDQPSGPLPAGTYMVTARLLERNGAMQSMDLTQNVTTMVTVADKQQAGTTVNFSWDKFTQSYTGNLFFQTASWQQPGDADAGTGGLVVMGCASANVNKVRFWLRRGGSLVPGVRTTSGVMLDGNGIYDCHTPTGPTDNYYTVQDLPWGLYELVVGGYLTPGQLTYCSASQVFVGAGSTNPTYRLTTQATSAPSCP